MARSYAEEGPAARHPGVRYDISEYTMTMLTLALLCRNASVTHRMRIKFWEFLEKLDFNLYSDVPAARNRGILALAVSRAVVRDRIEDFPLVKARILENSDWREEFEVFFSAYEGGGGHLLEGSVLQNELSTAQVEQIDRYVSTRLSHSYIWEHGPRMVSFLQRLEAGDYGDMDEFNAQFLDIAETMVRRGRESKALTGFEALDFRTSDNTFETVVRAAVVEANRPQACVKTGMKLFNQMLNGGYHGRRVYIHFGRSGDWKSGMLCHAAWWACDPRFNTYTLRDPTKKPVVLMVSQENETFETIERMTSYSLGSGVTLKGATPTEMAARLGQAFGTSEVAFAFKYRPTNTISTADLDQMVEDEALEGYEVVMLIHDYIKRIKAVRTYRDQRHLELGSVVDEMGAIAKKYGIPVVTAMQLTREAYAKLDAAIKSNKADGLKELGAGQVGESINVYENADVVIFQNRQTMASSGKMYLNLKRVKFRGQLSGVSAATDFFSQPFATERDGTPNQMHLEEDAHLPNHCFGTRDLADAAAADYDANDEGRPAGGMSRAEREAARSGEATMGPSASRRRIAATGPRRTPAPHGAGALPGDGRDPSMPAEDIEGLDQQF